LKVFTYYPKSIRRLVKKIYSFDYAPYIHLIEKTKYLRTTPKEVFFVFFENNDPLEDFFGEGSFRHIESIRLKKIKEYIRNEFNPRINGEITENHIIHASDNESQTNYILQYLGYKSGINILKNSNLSIWHSNIISAGYYVIRYLDISKLFAQLPIGTSNNYKYNLLKIQDTPHYQGLSNNMDIYNSYMKSFIGGPIIDYYSEQKFRKLATDFNYLAAPHETEYIVVKKHLNDNYLILDGLHRAAILLGKKNNTVMVAEIA